MTDAGCDDADDARSLIVPGCCRSGADSDGSDTKDLEEKPLVGQTAPQPASPLSAGARQWRADHGDEGGGRRRGREGRGDVDAARDASNGDAVKQRCRSPADSNRA